MPNGYIPTAGEGTVPQWLGTYPAIVVSNNDPLGVGRLQLQVPMVLGAAVSNWAVPAGSYFSIPGNNTTVSCVFLGGDPSQPAWNGPLDLSPIVEAAAPPTVTYAASAPADPRVHDVWYEIFTDANGNQIVSAPQVWTFNSMTSTFSWVVQGNAYNNNGGGTGSAAIGANSLIEASQFVGESATGVSGFFLYPAGFTPGTTMPLAWIANGTVDPYGVVLPASLFVPGGQVNGTAILPGTVGTVQVNFDAANIGGMTASIGQDNGASGGSPPTSPNFAPPNVDASGNVLGPNDGDIWFDDMNGYVLNQYSQATNGWTVYQFGTNAIQNGAITTAQLSPNAVGAGQVAAGALDGFTINNPTFTNATTSDSTDTNPTELIYGNQGAVVGYGTAGGGVVSKTFTSTGSFVMPAGVVGNVVFEAWGGGGGGNTGSSTSAGAGGGGGGYLIDVQPVTAGQTVNFTIGAAGGAGANGSITSISGAGLTTMNANGGVGATGTTGGAGGTFSGGSGSAKGKAGGTGGAASTGTNQSVTLTPSSTSPWGKPAGPTTLTVQCWGAGSGADGGGLAGGANSGGYGGAGGAFASSILTGQSSGTHNYNFSVGSGGAGGAANNNGSSASGDTNFDSVVIAKSATVSSGISTPGSGSASTGTTKHSGGSGGTATGSGGGGGGGSAGTNGSGGGGTNNTGSGSVSGGAAGSGSGASGGSSGASNASGSGGNSPGAGGGGGGGGSSAGHGGAGANGKIVISYLNPGDAGGGGGGSSAGGTGNTTPSSGSAMSSSIPTGIAGNAGSAGTTGTGGAGGAAVTSGGAGAAGGNNAASGSIGSAPGGGGGGAGAGGSSGGAGAKGQVRITYYVPATSTAVTASFSPVSQTDPGGTGSTIPAGYMGPTVAIHPSSSPAAAETWQTATLTGTWTAAQTLKYKLMPDNSVAITGRVGNGTGGGLNITTLPTGYYNPTNIQWGQLTVQNVASTSYPVQLTTGGILQLTATPPASTTFYVNLRMYLDN